MKITKTKLITFAACYLAFAAAFLLYGIIGFAKENAAYKNGSLSVQELSVSDFEFNAVKTPNIPWPGYKSSLATSDADPYFIYDKGETYINGISFTLKSHILPGEARLYYKLPGDAGYTVRHSVSPISVNAQTGEYVFKLPVKKAASLRLDMVSAAGCVFEISDITLNHTPCAADYFVPNEGEICAFLFMPAVVYAIIRSVALAFDGVTLKKGEKNKRGE